MARSVLIEVVKDVADAMSQPVQLSQLLGKAIAAVAKAMRADVGAIYLYDVSHDELLMAAATGLDAGLVGIASYKIGQGLTGSIAKDKCIVTFASHNDMMKDPRWIGKYDSLVWKNSNAKCETFLGVPIVAEDKLLGVWKIANISPSEEHPAPYFTEEDVHTAQVLSLFLAYAIQRERDKAIHARWAALLSDTSLAMLAASTEEEAIDAALLVMGHLEFSAMLSLYYPDTGMICGHVATGEKWSRIVEITQRPLDGDDVMAIALRDNKAIFVGDARHDPRCDIKTARLADVTCFFVVPVRLDDDLIGTLMVDMDQRSEVDDETVKMVTALAGCLAIAVSRIRAIRRATEMTEQVMGGSRLIVAETLSAMAIHSFGHRVDSITRNLSVIMDDKRVKGDQNLRSLLSRWHDELGEVEGEIRNALNFVRSTGQEGFTDIHEQIQETISMWYNVLRTHDCKIKHDLQAVDTVVRASPDAAREIIAVLLVNSAQAYSKNTTITTWNQSDYDLPKNHLIKNAICIEVADNGIGLATGDPEEIFKPTYSTKSKEFGTGLGLFIARSLANRAGGELFVQGRGLNRKGVAFRLVLPSYPTKRGTNHV